MDGPQNQEKVLRSTVSSKAYFVSYQQGTIFKYCCENRTDTSCEVWCRGPPPSNTVQGTLQTSQYSNQNVIPRSVCEGPSKEKQKGGEEKADT